MNFVYDSPLYTALWGKARKEKVCDWRDFGKWVSEHPGEPVTPFMFGCPDWTHNGDGVLDNWAMLTPVYTKEELAAIAPPPTRESQRYHEVLRELDRYDNDRIGWNRMVDIGLSNDLWRDRGKYYSYTHNGAL